MPPPNNSQRIDELIGLTSALNERILAIRIDLDALKGTRGETGGQIHQMELRIARMEVDLGHVKDKLGVTDPNERLTRVEEGLRHAREKLDQRDSRRFEITKIVISALVASIIGGAVGAGYQWLPKVFESLRTHRGSPAERP